MATFTVNKSTDNGLGTTAGTLSYAIVQANKIYGDDTIVLTRNIRLTGPTVIPSFIDSNISLEGNGFSLSGDVNNNKVTDLGDTRPLFIKSGVVSISNLKITNGCAQGENGGGGGAGMGGGLFIYDGSVTLNNVTFSNNKAIGGNGGLYGRGGGMGIPGIPANNGADGENGTVDSPRGGNGENGGLGGNGGNGGDELEAWWYEGWVNGGGWGGDGGWGGHGGDGGYGYIGGSGGRGGFGGGGGLRGRSGWWHGHLYAENGDGGFGGGGGAGGWGGDWDGAASGEDGNASNGGYGGGGGTGSYTYDGNYDRFCSGGQGGFGAGDSLSYDAQTGAINDFGAGGGGAGMGGGLFIRSGSLSLNNVTFTNNRAEGGTGHENGKGLGGGLFIMQSLTNPNGNNQGMPAVLPVVTATAGTLNFSRNSAADDSGTFTDNDNIWGVLFNDNFANRTTLTGNDVTVTGTNVGATGETGEPDHDSASTPLNSVWYSWTATSNGRVTISTAGSSFDTTLGVYQGTMIAGLTVVASNDDLDWPDISTSQVEFDVVSGATYQIAVDGYSGATGNINLSLKQFIFIGTPNADNLVGTTGADTLMGLGRNDTYTVNNNGDVVVENLKEGTDTVKASISYTLPDHVEKLTLTGSAAINGTGNTLKNTLTGNSAANILNGGAGSDTLTGKGGADIFLFRFGESQASTAGLDRIMDFAIGTDKIDLLTQSGSATGAPVAFTRAADTTATNLNSIVTGVFADANGALAGAQPLGVNSAALVKSVTETYLIVNDANPGFQLASDLLINIRGYTGSLPNFGAIPVDSFFV